MQRMRTEACLSHIVIVYCLDGKVAFSAQQGGAGAPYRPQLLPFWDANIVLERICHLYRALPGLLGRAGGSRRQVLKLFRVSAHYS